MGRTSSPRLMSYFILLSIIFTLAVSVSLAILHSATRSNTSRFSAITLAAATLSSTPSDTHWG